MTSPTRACEQEDETVEPPAPMNNLEQFCTLLCRGLEVRKVPLYNKKKRPYSRIIWLHNDRDRFLIGKSKRAGDSNDVLLTDICDVICHGTVPERFAIVTAHRTFWLDVDTINSRNILVRMLGKMVSFYHTKDEKYVQQQSAFKARVCQSGIQQDCAICMSPITAPIQLRCGHTYCSQCIEDWRLNASATASCPECRAPLPPGAQEHLGRASRLLKLRDAARKKSSLEKTERSFQKKTRRALALIQQAYEMNPLASTGKSGSTAMILVSRHGDKETISLLLNRELTNGTSTLNYQDSNGITPLHASIRAGKTENVQALLAHGADVNAKDNQLVSPLALAVSLGSRKTIRNALVQAGATLTKREYAQALRRRNAEGKIGRRPLWDLLGCYGLKWKPLCNPSSTASHSAVDESVVVDPAQPVFAANP